MFDKILTILSPLFRGLKYVGDGLGCTGLLIVLSLIILMVWGFDVAMSIN